MLLEITVISSMAVSLAILFMNSSHPLVFMAIILIQTVIMCVAAWIGMSMSWFSYILFLIFLGGLMVLFVYTVSLASNEIMFLATGTLTFPLTTLFLLSVLLLLSNEESLTSTPDLIQNKFFLMYAIKGGVAILFTMLYLLFTLIVVVKIADKFEAPMKSLVFLN